MVGENQQPPFLMHFNLPESTLHTIRTDREKITVAFKAGAGSASSGVSSGQSITMALLKKMLVTWTDHRKRQGLNVTFNDTKKKVMDYCRHVKEKETGPIPEFSASTGWFYKLRTATMHSVVSSALVRLRALTRTPLLRTRIVQGPSSRRGDTSPSRCLPWMKWVCCGRRCLNTRTSRGRRSLPLASKRSRTISPSCWGLIWWETANWSPSWSTMLRTLVHPRVMIRPTCLSTCSPTQVVGWRAIFSRPTARLGFKILMDFDNAPAHPKVLPDLHSDIEFVFLPPNAASLLHDQNVLGTSPWEVVAFP